MSKWEIRWRLTIWNTIVLILVLLAFATAMLITLRHHLYHRDDMVLIEELNELIEEFGRPEAEANLVRQLEQRFAVHARYYFQVANADRVVLFRSRFLSSVSLPMPDRPAELRGRQFQDLLLPKLGHYRLLTQATRDSHGKALLAQVVTSRAALDREFSFYLWITLALLSAGAIAAWISGFLLAKWALDPIDRIIGTAERISAETLSERLQVTNSHDELGRLAATLNRMFDRLHGSLDQMRRFTADAAHELRSPLAAMRTRAEVVLQNDRPQTIYRQAIAVNLEETMRLGELVDQLLMLSRHDAGLPSRFHDDVQLDALIHDVTDRFESAALEKNIKLEIACDAECIVHGDDVGLSQLFFNLLHNAIKYTPAGGHVRIIGTNDETAVRITIEDTGVGISAEHLPRIFDRFYRIDYSRNRELGGAGLGLAICKAIADAHRGEITVRSEPGHGTQFLIVLPHLTDSASSNGKVARNVQPA